jgi:hypothetical protein
MARIANPRPAFIEQYVSMIPESRSSVAPVANILMIVVGSCAPMIGSAILAVGIPALR